MCIINTIWMSLINITFIINASSTRPIEVTFKKQLGSRLFRFIVCWAVFCFLFPLFSLFYYLFIYFFFISCLNLTNTES